MFRSTLGLSSSKPDWVFDWPDLSPVQDGGITSALLVSDLSDKF